MVGGGISLETTGIIIGIVASLATIVGLAIVMVDRRRKKVEASPAQIQNVYLTQAAPSAPSTEGEDGNAKSGFGPETTEDTRYALLLEACIWLASDLYLVGPTMENQF